MIASFDLETTGTDTSTDRIVQIGIHFEGAEREDIQTLVNPGIPIPESASEVHGITDEHVATAPHFSVVAELILERIAGCHLMGFNLHNFDVPLLWEEFHRNGFSWDPNDHQIIDVFNLYRQLNPRTLSAAVQQYLGRSHDDAHGAHADAKATADVLRAMRAAHPEIDVPVEELASVSRMDRRVDLAGKIVLSDQGVPCYNFGKNYGRPVAHDPSYAQWMLGGNFPEHTKQVLRKILQG